MNAFVRFLLVLAVVIVAGNAEAQKPSYEGKVG